MTTAEAVADRIVGYLAKNGYVTYTAGEIQKAQSIAIETDEIADKIGLKADEVAEAIGQTEALTVIERESHDDDVDTVEAVYVDLDVVSPFTANVIESLVEMPRNTAEPVGTSDFL